MAVADMIIPTNKDTTATGGTTTTTSENTHDSTKHIPLDAFVIPSRQQKKIQREARKQERRQQFSPGTVTKPYAESSEGLSPTADDGRQKAPLYTQESIGQGFHSRNSAERAAAELDRREATSSTPHATEQRYTGYIHNSTTTYCKNNTGINTPYVSAKGTGKGQGQDRIRTGKGCQFEHLQSIFPPLIPSRIMNDTTIGDNSALRGQPKEADTAPEPSKSQADGSSSQSRVQQSVYFNDLDEHSDDDEGSFIGQSEVLDYSSDFSDYGVGEDGDDDCHEGTPRLEKENEEVMEWNPAEASANGKVDRVRKQRRKRSAILRARLRAGASDAEVENSAKHEPNIDHPTTAAARTGMEKTEPDNVYRSGPLRGLACESIDTSSIANLMEGEAIPQLLMNDAEWNEVSFDVALDSGCTDNVCHTTDIPGYSVEPSAGSRCGQGFIVGNGARVPNDGQAHLNLETVGEVLNMVNSTFQVAKVSRPLMSVGRLCESGMRVIFEKNIAKVEAPGDSVVCVFERQPGGLYTTKFKLKKPPPPGFVRPV